MHDITQATSTEINRLHQLATKTASEAVEYAKQIGELLLKVKEQLPYGDFGGWIEQNLTVSARQAQRYMAVAQGKPIPVRDLAAKYDTVSQLQRNDTVSHLSYVLTPEEVDSVVNGTWMPEWRPEAGHCYSTSTENGSYWVVPDLKQPERFHVSRLYGHDTEDDGGLFDGTRWAESADLVEIRLKQFQLPEPSKATWKVSKRAGLSAPFGAPEGHGKIKVVGKNGQVRWLQDAP